MGFLQHRDGPSCPPCVMGSSLLSARSFLSLFCPKKCELVLKMFKYALFSVSLATKTAFLCPIGMTAEICDIVKACQRRERRAQKQLYDAFAPMVMGVCLRYGCSRDEAQDLLQDTFLTVFEKIGSLSDPQSFVAWLKRIAVNNVINYVARACSHECLVGGASEMAAVAERVGQPFDTDVYAIDHIMHAISKLPPDYALVFNALEVDGVTPAEVCLAMGVKEVTVRTYLHRARQMLQELVRCDE